MRNKICKTLAALCASFVLMGGFSVTALAQGESPLAAANTTNDANVVVEDSASSTPLTPEGNAALVDDFGGNKQLITVTTKAGNYFYILVDRANEDKQTAVHFLNQVDEIDLMALMENEEITEEPPAVCSCEQKCEIGAVNADCAVCAANRTACEGKAPEPAAETAEPDREQSGRRNPAMLILLLVLLGGGGFAYFKFIKSKDGSKNNSNPDDYDDADRESDSEEWETEDEEQE